LCHVFDEGALALLIVSSCELNRQVPYVAICAGSRLVKGFSGDSRYERPVKIEMTRIFRHRDSQAIEVKFEKQCLLAKALSSSTTAGLREQATNERQTVGLQLEAWVTGL
jgi:hypothetical protein